jgi:glycosyltransferase involved in cell wall biosynthesis
VGNLVKVAQISPTFFGPDSVLGGAERYALELARGLARKVRTTLFTFSRRIARVEVTHDRDLEVRTYPVRLLVKGDLANPLSFRFLRDLRACDVIHCYGYPTVATDLAMLWATLFRRALFVTDVGGGGACPSSYLSKLGIDTRRAVDGFLLLSAYSAHGYQRHAERVEVIYGGVDASLFRPQGLAREPRVLFVGRLIPAKGVDDLITATDSKTSLRIVGQKGNDRYFSDLSALARGKNIEFSFHVTDQALVREYGSASVTVVPSVNVDMYGHRTTAELLGLVALESMSCETPVVATRCGSLPEVVEDGVTGFLVDANDPPALRDRVDYLLAHPEKAREMGKAGRERVMRLFTWDRVVERCLHAYGRAVAALHGAS